MSLKLTFATVLCFAFVSSAFGATIPPNNGRIQCDQLLCPVGARRCTVRTYNDPSDFSTLIRSRTCLDKDNNVVAQQNTKSPNANNDYINVTNFDFTQMTPEERAAFQARMQQSTAQLNNNLSQMQRDIQEQVRRNLAQSLPNFG